MRWESGNEKLKGAEHKETKREGEGKKKTGEKTAAKKVLHEVLSYCLQPLLL